MSCWRHSPRGIAVPASHRPRRRLPEYRPVLRRVAAAVTALMLLSPPTAQGHGDADWIQRDIQWRWCCGPEDCRPAVPGEVQPTEKGFLVPRTNQLFHEGMRGFYYHRHDQDFWICVRGGAVICLFVPEGMS